MLRHLTDAADPALAAYRDVGNPAALERDGLFVVEGRLIVERLLEGGRFRVHSVAVTEPAAVALAAVFAARPDVSILVCEPDLLRTVTGFDFHRGCLALAWRPAVDALRLGDFTPAGEGEQRQYILDNLPLNLEAARTYKAREAKPWGGRQARLDHLRLGDSKVVVGGLKTTVVE